MSAPLKLVKPRPRIRNKEGKIVGVICARCSHERFPYMKACPKCDDTALRDLDTSTNDLKLESWALLLGWLALLARVMALRTAA